MFKQSNIVHPKNDSYNFIFQFRISDKCSYLEFSLKSKSMLLLLTKMHNIKNINIFYIK